MPEEKKSINSQTIIQFITVLVLMFSIAVTAYLTISQHQWAANIRKHQVAPNIQLSQDTHWSPNYGSLNIRFINVGNGIAQDIFLFVSSGERVHPTVLHNFRTVRPVGKEGPDQKYILPGQTVECSIDLINLLGDTLGHEYLALSKDDRANATLKHIYTFYFSYFDSDDKEHLMVAKYPPTGISGPLIFDREGSRLDSLLLALSDSIPTFSKRTFEDHKIRSDIRWIKKELGEQLPIEE